MKQNIGFSQFTDAFHDMGRGDQFTYEGKRALFNYLEQLEDDMGEEIELDVIALCCDYTEYPSAWDAMKEYQPDDMPVEGEEGDDLEEIQEKNEKAAHEWLSERTTVIDVKKGGVIIQAF